MNREELLKKVGSMQQLAYVRPIQYQEGRTSGLKAFEVKNGPLTYHVLGDKCLDVGQFTYKGINMNFLSKPGLQGRNHYDTNGDEALRSIMGGLFFTAGLENICAPYTGKEAEWNRMDPPKDNEPEYVFIHEPVANEDGEVVVSVLNDELKLGIQIRYTSKYLPRFMEWKSTASGDYVLGLEPSNSSVYGRSYHEEHGDLHMLEPFAKETNVLTFTVLEGEEELKAAREENARLLAK